MTIMQNLKIDARVYWLLVYNVVLLECQPLFCQKGLEPKSCLFVQNFMTYTVYIQLTLVISKPKGLSETL